MMKACRWVEKDVKFVKQICSWRQVLLGDSGTFFPLMYANAQLSTFTGAHYGLVFFSAVCCLSNFTLFILWWGWWQSNKLPFRKWSDTCWKITAWSCRFCPTPMHTAIFLSHLHLLALALVVMKKADRKISPYSASEAQWPQRWHVLGRQIVNVITWAQIKMQICFISVGPNPRVWSET